MTALRCDTGQPTGYIQETVKVLFNPLILLMHLSIYLSILYPPIPANSKGERAREYEFPTSTTMSG